MDSSRSVLPLRWFDAAFLRRRA